MALDVEVPDPPDMRGPQPHETYESVDPPEEESGDGYRREELSALLEAGAWEAGFAEWADTTLLSESEFEVARDLGLVEALDFYWVPATGDVGYWAPTRREVPDDDRLDREDVAMLTEELDALGRAVSERLEDDLDRVGEEFGFFADRE